MWPRERHAEIAGDVDDPVGLALAMIGTARGLRRTGIAPGLLAYQIVVQARRAGG